MHVETAVFIDRELYQHMSANYPKNTERELLRFVLAMINGVQLLYHDPSLGHPVNFLLKRLEILHEDPSGLRRPQDIDDFLSSFCGWQRQENPIADSDPLHWDHALILTGLDLYVVSKAGKLSHQVVGLAPVGGMCTTTSSCTVNEGRHFESVYVVAHEIGHNLGMRHDGPLADNECDPTSYIMSPTLGSGKITWSMCSKLYLQKFLDSTQSHCLLDHGSSAGPLDHSAEGSLPGERFNADQQCMLKYGAGSSHSLLQSSEEICRDLHCRREKYTWTSHPALEGTQCGFNMWCRGGECVLRSPPISADDVMSSSYTQGPAWTPWSPFSECASACLDGPDGHQNSALEEGSTGVRISMRKCNLHRFQNSDPACKGHDKKYLTCNAPQCEDINRMTVEEFSDEICTRARDVDSELTGRSVLIQDRNPVDACAVWCATRGGGRKSRGWSLPDGTSCRSGVSSKPGSASGFYCISGRCEEFKCKVNSDSRFQLSAEYCQGFSNRVDLWDKPETYSRGNYKGKRGLAWQQSGSCHYNCMESGSGIRLITSKSKPKMSNIQLCHQNINECTRVWSTFQYATAICTKYKERVKRLSGLGMQISPTTDEKHRACRVACQDEKLQHRFYLVNGPSGWFPFGTDCSRGRPIRAYCVSGQCLEFGTDGIPISDTSWLLKSNTPNIMRLR
ncbi:A disintegrin and metalloproteinase with thrombospondin motifs adt-2-like [Ctenocephalides felis]|uniref:A disintegrin and metalloproteinase with thrombospondin motifs adt-2-like n=1 Tax=Ctenocephalides felis TaxID=7515 RepID=UPI000E6E1D9E|nr:A disintegrin and metalloproteinase with thrombospondin motifs adt-2-like [Ctenocephalides felis]